MAKRLLRVCDPTGKIIEETLFDVDTATVEHTDHIKGTVSKRPMTSEESVHATQQEQQEMARIGTELWLLHSIAALEEAIAGDDSEITLAELVERVRRIEYHALVVLKSQLAAEFLEEKLI